MVCGGDLRLRKEEKVNGERDNTVKGKSEKKRGLEEFGAYRTASELFDLARPEPAEGVAEDIGQIPDRKSCWKLIAQQLGSTDSICANVEEGYGRYSPKEYIQYLVVSRGSAQETKGRYHRMRHWLPSSNCQSPNCSM